VEVEAGDRDTVLTLVLALSLSLSPTLTLTHSTQEIVYKQGQEEQEMQLTRQVNNTQAKN
jgi:hypothetical protein